MFRKIIFIFVVVIFSGIVSAGDIPRVIMHQGYLTDTNGNPVNGNINISFGIYDVESGGNPLLEEDIGSIEIKDGFYAIEIGRNINLMSLFSDRYNLFLEIKINNEALTPRQRIGSVPFAFTAYDVVGDIHPTSITIGGNKIIDENGVWVGNASSLPGVKEITINSPLIGGVITDTGSIGISKADSSTNGYLSKEDFGLFSSKQNRIVGVCQTGSCVSKINEDGSVECDLCGGGGGSISISAGTGIVVDPNPIVGVGTISIDKIYFDNLYIQQGQTDSITTAMIQDKSITLNKLNKSNCSGGQVIKYYIEQPGIEYFTCAADNVGSVNITGSNGIAVSPDPITSSGSISLTSAYQDGSAYDTRFVNVDETDSINTTMIKDRAVTFSKIADNSCLANQYIKWDGINWVCATIGGGTVTQIDTADPLQGGPITTSGTISLKQEYKDGSAYDNRFVNEGQLDSITTAMIQDKSITLNKLNKSNCSDGQVIKYYIEQPGIEYFTCAADNNSGGTITSVTASEPLSSSGGTTPNISLKGIVPIENGGTGSSTQIFVDLSTDQTIGGIKTFSVAPNAPNYISTVGDGTAPLSVSSKTKVDNLNADMVDGYHASVTLSGISFNLYGTNSTSFVELERWAVDFDNIPGNSLRGIGFVLADANGINGELRFLVNGTQVGSTCPFNASTSIAPLNCPIITYTKPAGIGYISIDIRRTNTVPAGNAYYGYDTLILK